MAIHVIFHDKTDRYSETMSLSLSSSLSMSMSMSIDYNNNPMIFAFHSNLTVLSAETKCWDCNSIACN